MWLRASGLELESRIRLGVYALALCVFRGFGFSASGCRVSDLGLRVLGFRI